MKSSLRILSIALCFSALLLIPVLVKGQVEIENPLEADTFAELVDSLVNIIFMLAMAIAPLMIIIAGFYFVTAAGEPARITTAKQIIFWTLIGLLIVLCAKGIIALFNEVLGI